ncbi:MAG TPA: UpxY family transcription antiterminator [Cyclobacteriaceae bacterium]|nr:UpxY family transcription antiterminator [Cyclobacteriaceae bacterium]
MKESGNLNLLAPRKWFVFYTKSRQEKKVKEILDRRGFDVFLPLQKVIRQWSDRKKKVEVPLFNSYLFVAVPEHKIEEVLQVPGVAWLIRHNGRPAELHPAEYATILRFLETGLLLETGPAEEFELGERVVVLDGPLKGQEGFLYGRNKGKFTVVLAGLGQSIKLEINGLIIGKSKSA